MDSPSEKAAAAVTAEWQEKFDEAHRLWDEDQLEEALETFTELLSFFPNEGVALLNRGNLYYKMGRWDEAEADWDAARKNEPSLPEHLFVNQMLMAIMHPLTKDRMLKKAKVAAAERAERRSAVSLGTSDSVRFVRPVSGVRSEPGTPPPRSSLVRFVRLCWPISAMIGCALVWDPMGWWSIPAAILIWCAVICFVKAFSH